MGAWLAGAAIGQEGDAVVLDPVTGRNLLNAAVGDAGVYDGGTQYMMIDVLDVMLPGQGDSRVEGAGSAGLAPLPDGEAWYLATRADGEAVIFSGPSPDGPAVAVRRPTVRQEANVVAFLRSLGESSGAAFQLQMGSEAPIRFSGEGIVVEPLVIRDQARGALEAEITRLAAGSPVTRVLNAYCLEFLKGPPAVDQVFRIADEPLQQTYAPAANVLKAGRRLIEGGLLEGRPLDYVHSIKQWALWTAEGDFSFEAFSDRFLAHAEDNFTVAGMDWTEPVQALVEETLPERWEQIGAILNAAGELPGGIEWRR